MGLAVEDVGLLNGVTVVQTMLTVQLPSCGPNLIDHYFCDVHPLLKLACTDTYVVGLIVVANSGVISLSSFVILVGSYTVILLSLKTWRCLGG